MYKEENFKSQHEQDKVLLHFIGEKRNGFFIELGALDGIIISNTYFFEKELGWTGVLIEPIPESYENLKKNRNCHVSNALISDVSGIEKQFLMGGAGSGIINDEDPQQSGYYVRVNITNPRIKMITKTLDEVLDEFNSPNYIDFLSLDVEGHEYEVLKNFPFDKYIIDIICVENNSGIDKNDNMINFHNLMINKNYELLEIPDFRKGKPNDDYYKLKK
jgi:FkbM family methyltransferase